MQFDAPFLILLGIIAGTIWSVDFLHFFRRPEVDLPKTYIASDKKFFRTILLGIGILSWILISIGIGMPKKNAGFKNATKEANDIYFVVDVSLSMKANDFSPSRLEVAKEKIIDFVSMMPTDRIGVIIFSEKVFTLSPLSFDLQMVRKLISEIEIGYLGSGTNIGDGLGLAIKRLEKSKAKNKIVVLLTDGVSNVGILTPIQAAEMAKKNDVKVYTIGMGGNENAKIPLGGGRFQYLPGGSIDMETLKKISTMTLANTYTAKDERALVEAFKTIEGLEKVEVKAESEIIYEYEYYKYLLSGILLLLFVELIRRFRLKEAF